MLGTRTKTKIKHFLKEKIVRVILNQPEVGPRLIK